MLALSFGLLLVMGTVALLLADMERKRRIIVDLLKPVAAAGGAQPSPRYGQPAASQWQSGTSLQPDRSVRVRDWPRGERVRHHSTRG